MDQLGVLGLEDYTLMTCFALLFPTSSQCCLLRVPLPLSTALLTRQSQIEAGPSPTDSSIVNPTQAPGRRGSPSGLDCSVSGSNALLAFPSHRSAT
jgi:hypothetical protein